METISREELKGKMDRGEAGLPTESEHKHRGG
jgi:hypothetical protein